MKRFLWFGLVVLVACQGRDAGGGAERETPAGIDTVPMADTIDVTPDTVMARDTAF